MHQPHLGWTWLERHGRQMPKLTIMESVSDVGHKESE